MFKLFHYIATAQGAAAGVRGLPLPGRILVVLCALPGIVLLALSLAAVVVSIAALLLLTVPAYRLVRWVVGGGGAGMEPRPADFGPLGELGGELGARPPRRKIDVTIVDEQAGERRDS